MNVMLKQILGFLCVLILTGTSLWGHVIRHSNTVQVGDNIAGFATAKILSLKYNIPLQIAPFPHSNLFVLDDVETKWMHGTFDKKIQVYSEHDILNHINEDSNIVFLGNILTRIEDIDPSWIRELKALIQLKNQPEVDDLPTDKITVAVHIRKGNGGGEIYDGELSSQQQFNFDRSKVIYLYDYFNYPFEWESNTRINPNKYNKLEAQKRSVKRNTLVSQLVKTSSIVTTPMDQIGVYQTKFPPEQFYIDQLIMLSKKLKGVPLFVQIFTDDKEPEKLVERIHTAVNQPNITFHFENYRNLSFQEQIARDLFQMSRCQVLIRSQSYFSRAAELMGDPQIVIYPLTSSWELDKLIMDKVVVKGSFEELLGF